MIEVKGNGNIVSRELNVSTFVRLHLACRGTIELHQGEVEKVVIEADENLMDHFSALNAGRTLYVSTEEKIMQPVFSTCVVKVYLRQLNVLYVRNNNGNVVCPKQISLSEPLEIKVQSVGNTELFLSAPKIRIVCQAEGNTVLKGKAEVLEIKNQSHGDLDGSKFSAAELSIKNMADGNVRLHADRTISISHFGNGFVHYSGEAVVKDIKQYGSGEVKRVKQ